MNAASALKTGNVVRFDKDLHKVLEAVTHAGGGKAGGVVHLKLRNLSNGHISEKRLNPADKVEDIEVTRAKVQLLFREGESFTFMNQETFDQLSLPKELVGPAAAFLKENDECEVEFHEEKPLALIYPPIVELKVASTGADLHEDTLKEAALENGLTLLVPQFIKEGDRVRVDVETGKYLDRVSDREVKGAKFTVKAPPQKPAAEKTPSAAKPDAPKPGPKK